MDNAIIIICALLLNALLAGPKHLYDRLGIFALLHKPAGALRSMERKLNREHRSAEQRKMRGMVVVGAGLLGAIALGAVLMVLFASTSRFFELCLVALFLAVRPVWDVASAVRSALISDNLAQARLALDGTSWRHHARLDANGVARAAVESLAVQFSEKVFAPALWYFIAGLPGLFVCVLVTLMHETLAASGSEFGQPARRMYHIVHWLPSRLVGCLWVIAALFQTEGDIKQTAKNIWLYMATLSPQALQVACCASVTQVSLGGPSSVYTDKFWLGSGSVKLGPEHIKKAQYLFAVLHLLMVLLLGIML